MSSTQSHCLAHGGPTWTVDLSSPVPSQARHNQIRGGYHASILAVIVFYGLFPHWLAPTLVVTGDHDMVLWCASAKDPRGNEITATYPILFSSMLWFDLDSRYSILDLYCGSLWSSWAPFLWRG